MAIGRNIQDVKPEPKTDYEKGWNDAFDLIADYVMQEVCIVTADMIRRMKDEKWRQMKS